MIARHLLLASLILFATTLQAQDKQAKIEILQPQAGQEVQGTIDVRVKLTAPEGVALPSQIHVAFKGGPYAAADQGDGENEWTAKLDTTLAPNGEHTLTAITDNKRVNTSIAVTTTNPLKVYFGDLHSHTSYSDGTLLPKAAHDYARDLAQLDVFCLTDHLESVDDEEWLDTREVAWDANEDGVFAVIPGLEWTKKWGHLNIYDPKTRHWPADPQEFYKAAAEAGVVTKFNHPGDGTKSHSGLEYSEIGDQTVQLMEVRGDAEQKAFIRALDKGWHIAPEGSDDTHSPNWGNVRSWTGILMPGLSKRNVLDALANRRVYSTLDRNCHMRLRVNGAEMGEIIGDPVAKVEVAVRVSDPDAEDTIAKIELFENGTIVATDEPNAQGRCWNVERTPTAGKHYYFLKVTQGDGNLLWSAPVWVTVVE